MLSLPYGGCVQTYRRMLVDLVRMQQLEGVMEILTEMVFNEGRTT